MTTRIVKTALSGLCLGSFLLGVGAVKGATVYDLDSWNSALSGYGTPFGTVSVSLNGGLNVATFTFTALDSGGFHYLFGDGGSVGLNLNGAVNAFGGISSYTGYTGSTAPIFTAGGAGNEDGFGKFNFRLDNFDGFGYSVRSVTFSLTKSSGTWADDAHVLIGNLDGYFAAGHIFVADANYTSAVVTGYSASDGTTTGHEILPDGGSTVALLGFGLLGIGALRQRLSRK